MKKLIIFITLFCISNITITAQDTSNVIYGAIPSFTAVPYQSCFAASIGMGLYSSSSLFTNDSKKKSFSEFLGPAGDANINILTYYISGMFSLSEAFGFQIVIPFISSQIMDFDLNRGWRIRRSDYYGQSGMGDMSIGIWHFFSKNNKNRIQATFDYIIPTGTPPNKLEDYNFSSTGSGHSSFMFGINWDLITSSRFYVSFNGSYVLKTEAKYINQNVSWIQDNGDEFHFLGQITNKFTETFSIGLRTIFLSSAALKIDGKEINDSKSNLIQIMPMLGFKINPKKNPFSLILGYSTYITGKNIYNFQGFHISIMKFYN